MTSALTGDYSFNQSTIIDDTPENEQTDDSFFDRFASPLASPTKDSPNKYFNHPDSPEYKMNLSKGKWSVISSKVDGTTPRAKRGLFVIKEEKDS